MRHFNRDSLDYSFNAKLTAGLVLTGPEAKSLRIQPPQFRNSHIEIINGQPVLFNLFIQPYKFASTQVVNTTGQINLLLSQKEIKELQSLRHQKYMLVPITIFPQGKWLKLELGVGRKMRKYEKREKIKARDLAREVK
jgi:SsrA-binding protein